MQSFKAFLTEAKTAVSSTNLKTSGIPTDIAKEILKYKKEASIEGSKTVYITIRSKDRQKTADDFQRKFNAHAPRNERTSKSSFPATVIDLENRRKLVILYKPLSGGMTETTLNSSITELFPCLMWYYKINTKQSVDKIYRDILAIKNPEKCPCFLTKGDAKSGLEFVASADTSSRFKEKVENAVGIFEYLVWLNRQNSIKDVFWTYRAKPAGVDSKSPADIVVKHQDGTLFGVSLKAGGKKTKEPLLNTYMNPILEYFGVQRSLYDRLVWDGVYSQIEGLKQNYAKDKQTFDILDALETADPDLYNELYDKYLDISRDFLVSTFNDNQKKSLKFVKERILRISDKVPVVIIKAIGKKWKQVEDENILAEAIKMAKGVKAYEAQNSKQNWFLDILDQDGNTTGQLSVRTNQPGVKHKLGQFSLAVKFNGVK